MNNNTSGKKITSQVSGREIILLAVFLIFLELYFLFFQILLPKYQDYQAERTINSALTQTVADLKVEFGKMDQYQAELALAKEEEQVMKDMLPPYTANEEQILLLDKLAGEAQLMVSTISFANLTSIDIATFLATPATTSSPAVEANAAVESSGYLLADQQISLSFSGTYSSVYSFLNLIEKSNRRAFVKNLAMSADEKQNVSGSLQLSLLSLVDTNRLELFQMDLLDIPGKSSPFTPYSGYGITQTIAAPSFQAVIPDFVLYLNSYLDNAPQIILTDYNDAGSRVTSEQNKSAAPKLSLSKSGRGYSYTLSLDGKTAQSAGTIDARDGKIVVEVISQSRRDNKDVSSAVLAVNNNSGIPVQIVISKDDSKNPRFKLGLTSGEVKMGS